MPMFFVCICLFASGNAINVLGLWGLGEARDCLDLRSSGQQWQLTVSWCLKALTFHFCTWFWFTSKKALYVLVRLSSSEKDGHLDSRAKESPKAVWAFTSLDAFRRPLRLYPVEGLKNHLNGWHWDYGFGVAEGLRQKTHKAANDFRG